jgi:hypothetical protein
VEGTLDTVECFGERRLNIFQLTLALPRVRNSYQRHYLIVRYFDAVRRSFRTSNWIGPRSNEIRAELGMVNVSRSGGWGERSGQHFLGSKCLNTVRR